MMDLAEAHRAVANDPALGLDHLTLNPDCEECWRFVEVVEEATPAGRTDG